MGVAKSELSSGALVRVESSEYTEPQVGVLLRPQPTDTTGRLYAVWFDGQVHVSADTRLEVIGCPLPGTLRFVAWVSRFVGLHVELPEWEETQVVFPEPGQRVVVLDKVGPRLGQCKGVALERGHVQVLPDGAKDVENLALDRVFGLQGSSS